MSLLAKRSPTGNSLPGHCMMTGRPEQIYQKLNLNTIAVTPHHHLPRCHTMAFWLAANYSMLWWAAETKRTAWKDHPHVSCQLHFEVTSTAFRWKWEAWIIDCTSILYIYIYLSIYLYLFIYIDIYIYSTIVYIYILYIYRIPLALPDVACHTMPYHAIPCHVAPGIRAALLSPVPPVVPPLFSRQPTAAGCEAPPCCLGLLALHQRCRTMLCEGRFTSLATKYDTMHHLLLLWPKLWMLGCYTMLGDLMGPVFHPGLPFSWSDWPGWGSKSLRRPDSGTSSRGSTWTCVFSWVKTDMDW